MYVYTYIHTYIHKYTHTHLVNELDDISAENLCAVSEVTWAQVRGKFSLTVVLYV
jgi:hypothetical protein